MKPRQKSRLLICAVLVVASYSFAQETGPFGLRAGMTRKQVQQIVPANAVISQKGDEFTYSTAPQPNPLFEEYILTFSPRYGLVQVQATANSLDDESGSLTRSRCKEIHSALSKKYGIPDKSRQCELKTENEKPCTLRTESMWLIDSPRADQIGKISLTTFLMPSVKNQRGEDVVAGCNDPHKLWKGKILLRYEFADYPKYEEEK
jgi:hypothetical protein